MSCGLLCGGGMEPPAAVRSGEQGGSGTAAAEGVTTSAAGSEGGGQTGQERAAAEQDEQERAAAEQDEQERTAVDLGSPPSLGDDEFPDEALVMVCCNLNVRELGRLGCVARRFTRPMVTQAGHKLLSPIEEGARQQLAEAASEFPERQRQARWVEKSWLVALYWSSSVDRYVCRIGKYAFDPHTPQLYPSTAYDEQGHFRAMDEESGAPVALRLVRVVRNTAKAELRRIIEQLCVPHKFIVPIKDVVCGFVHKTSVAPRDMSDLHLGFVIDRANRNLPDAISSKFPLPEDRAKVYFRQVLFAIAQCHKRGAAFSTNPFGENRGLLKLDDLMLTPDKTQCRICPVGLPGPVNPSFNSIATMDATITYEPPELFSGPNDYDVFKGDMWSLGVCLHVAVEGRFPFRGRGEEPTRIIPENLKILQSMKRGYRAQDLKHAYSPEFSAFLGRMLQVNVADRYTAEEALLDPWMLSDEFTADSIATTLANTESMAGVVAKPNDYATQEAWSRQLEILLPDDDSTRSSEDEDCAF